MCSADMDVEIADRWNDHANAGLHSSCRGYRFNDTAADAYPATAKASFDDFHSYLRLEQCLLRHEKRFSGNIVEKFRKARFFWQDPALM